MRAEIAPNGRWSVVLPFYNEEAFLGATLASLAGQSRPPTRIILVDNASGDGSLALAKAFAARLSEIDVVVLSEPIPGKANALARGVDAVETPFVATCDADTYYPPSYLETADRLFEKRPDAAVVLALAAPDARSPASVILRAKGAVAARLMPSQAHGGGYGQSFRVEALRAAGGFSAKRWPYCLIDHEIVHRASRRGAVVHAFDHWCAPSPRRGDRTRVRWRLDERLAYHLTPASRRDWLFYEFLAARFAARGLSALNLRERYWESPPHAARRSDLPVAIDA
jgi:glycosyltransferase involved in cell wall biosynthesis